MPLKFGSQFLMSGDQGWSAHDGYFYFQITCSELWGFHASYRDRRDGKRQTHVLSPSPLNSYQEAEAVCIQKYDELKSEPGS